MMASWRKLRVGDNVRRIAGKGAVSAAGQGWVEAKPPAWAKGVGGEEEERRYRKCERNEEAGRIEGG